MTPGDKVTFDWPGHPLHGSEGTVIRNVTRSSVAVLFPDLEGLEVTQTFNLKPAE